MDPLSHVVIGRALTAALKDEPRRFGRGAGAAAVLGALSPDVDGLLIPFGWDIYLRAHEIGTHSIAGGVVVACASAGIVRAFASRSRYRPLAAAATAGAMSHLALDVLSGARIRLVWPFADPRVSIPVTAMADPWFVAICVAGLCTWLSLGRTWGRTWGRTPQMVARATLVAAATLLGVKGALLGRTIRLSTVPIASFSALEAHWGSFTEWTVFERTPTAVRMWNVNSRGTPPALVVSVPIEAESALVQRSTSLDTVRNFLRTHDFDFPVERSAEGLTSVLWSDLRYCWPTGVSKESFACALWFGGRFAADGRAINQEVRIGGWTQTRPAAP